MISTSQRHRCGHRPSTSKSSQGSAQAHGLLLKKPPARCPRAGGRKGTASHLPTEIHYTRRECFRCHPANSAIPTPNRSDVPGTGTELPVPQTATFEIAPPPFNQKPTR
jgi:hypothetical protein